MCCLEWQFSLNFSCVAWNARPPREISDAQKVLHSRAKTANSDILALWQELKHAQKPVAVQELSDVKQVTVVLTRCIQVIAGDQSSSTYSTREVGKCIDLLDALISAFPEVEDVTQNPKAVELVAKAVVLVLQRTLACRRALPSTLRLRLDACIQASLPISCDIN